MSSRGQMTDPAGVGRVARPVLVSVAIGLLVCIGLLLLMSVILSTQNIPQSAVGPMAIFSISVGAFTAGFCCARVLRRGGLLFGAVCGAVMSAVVLLASLTIGDNGFGILAVLKIVFMTLSAMLGGVLGVNVRGRRK